MKNTIRTLIHLATLIVFGAVFGSFTSLAQPIPGQYIAVLKGDVPNPANAAQELARQHGVNVRHIYEHSIHGFAFEGNEKAAQALAHNPRIAYVEQDQLCQAWADPEIPSGLARIGIDQTILGQISPGRQNVNARIAIVDTGIAPHPDLNIDPNGVRFFVRGSKVVPIIILLMITVMARTWLEPPPPMADRWCCPWSIGHGIKVLDATGSGPTSVVIAGINYVAQNAAKFGVANMSLGGGFSQALNDAVTAATKVGVVFCVAAGNSGKDVQNYSPASTPSAITVSALTDLDAAPGGLAANLSDCLQDDAIACWSNFGSGVDICAPGVQIKSTWLNAGYNTISGTSMATPHVTGAAALYREEPPGCRRAAGFPKSGLRHPGAYRVGLDTE